MALLELIMWQIALFCLTFGLLGGLWLGMKLAEYLSQ